MTSSLTPDSILKVGFGFFDSKALLSAVELELFTILGSEGSLTGKAIGERLGLHLRGLYDFLDALVGMNFLDRNGTGNDSTYCNTAESAEFLDKRSPLYIGGILEFASSHIYQDWASLTTSLKTGEPRNKIVAGEDFFSVLYKDEIKLEQFMKAMQGFQLGHFIKLASTFDLSKYKTYCDVGGADGTLASLISKHNPHLNCLTFDLPVVEPIAQRNLIAMNTPKVKTMSGNFFVDPLPKADIITMGNILHDWNENEKQLLISKAYEALPLGGIFIAIECVIDNERQKNTFGMLMSLNMLVATQGGFDYTHEQFNAWAFKAGFERTEVIALTGPVSAVIAYK